MNQDQEAQEATDEVGTEQENTTPENEAQSNNPAEVDESVKVDESAPAPEPALPPLPETVCINEYRLKPLSEIYSMLEVLPVKIPAKASKSQLLFDLLTFYAKEGVNLVGEGILEQAKENYAMLRDPVKSFKTSPDDLYVNGHLISDHGLLVGQRVKVNLRAPKGRDKYLSASEVLEVEGMPVDQYAKPKPFDQLTAMFPDQRVILENRETGLSPRVLDLVAPLGKGQRGLIVAPPRGGKTILLKQIAKSIQLNHPEVELIVLLLDERPEEVTDFEETVDAEVFSSTFDEPSKRHAQVSDLVMERAKRLVELGKDVILLLDSLTRLARGHNNSQRGGGPIGSGGLSQTALQQSRKFFGAARNCEEGGSLTILASALIETESKMDEVIFEEFKGTGNMEVRLDRELAEQRIYPAIHIPQSGTRNDDRLYHPDEMAKV
ncbi:MAG: transcription termination factor Rho, partial [Akkermansiaceae bacterium]